MDILYLDDFINLYYNDKIYKITPYKHSLKEGKIINKEKFIKKMINELSKIGAKNKIFASNIKVIINNNYTKIDKEVIKDIMIELNYKNVIFVQELDYLDINKDKLFINCNYSYFYILFTDIYGNVEINTYKNDVYNKSIFINLIDNFNDRDIFLYGKNSGEFERLLNVYKKEYYVFEEKNNLILKKSFNR